MAVNRESAEGRPVSSGDAPKPADVAKTSAEPIERPRMKLFSVAGKVKEISAASLTLETKAKEYILDLTGAAIKIGVQKATVADLKEGDEIRVSYARSEDKLVAKTVARLVKPAK